MEFWLRLHVEEMRRLKNRRSSRHRQRQNPSYQLKELDCGLTQNLSGMVGYIQKLPAQNLAVRNKFLIKVMAANCEMAFIAEPDISKEFESILRKMVLELDAYIFAQPNKFFNKTNGQHFLDKNFNLILDTNGNCQIEDIDVNVDAKYHDGPSDNYSEQQLKRKQSSESILNSNNIKVNANLPCFPLAADTQVRTKSEIINRAYALLVIAARGEGVPMERLNKPIQDKDIKDFSPKERSILNTENLIDQDKAYATWRYESLNTILWTLNIMPELKFPNEICDVSTIVSAILQPSREEFEQNCKLRSTDEILNELDKTYRMNWACVDARFKNENVSGDINPSVIYERHYSLNWLTHYQDQAWDDIQTNT